MQKKLTIGNKRVGKENTPLTKIAANDLYDTTLC